MSPIPQSMSPSFAGDTLIAFSVPALKVPEFFSNVNLPELPPIEMSTMPDGGAVWVTIREFIAKLVQSVVQAPAAIIEFVKEHPEEFKTAGLVVLALIAVVVAACVLISIIPALLTLIISGLQFILASLNVVIQIAVRAVVTPVELVIKVVAELMNAISQAILSRAGFGSGGVRPHSFAARGQSSFYGPRTGGYFSKLQSMGATAGRR